MAEQNIEAHGPWFKFEPVVGMIDAILKQVAGLIAEQGWEVVETRVPVDSPGGKIIIPLIYDDGTGTKRIAYIEPGPWDHVAREDIDLWFRALDASPRAGMPVTLWVERDPPPSVLGFFGDDAERVKVGAKSS